jgi:hypothetical protein
MCCSVAQGCCTAPNNPSLHFQYPITNSSPALPLCRRFSSLLGILNLLLIPRMEPQIPRKPVSSVIEYETISDVNLIQSTSRTSGDLNCFANSRLIQRPNNDDDNNQSSDETKSTPANTYASWGVHWRKPAFIVSMLFAGLGLSLAHHFYYRSLNNQRTGDQTRQAWPTRIGTGLAFLVASCLRAATTVALGQYIWVAVKRRSLTIGTSFMRYAADFCGVTYKL